MNLYKFDDSIKCKFNDSTNISKSIISLYFNDEPNINKLFEGIYWNTKFIINNVDIYDKTLQNCLYIMIVNVQIKSK